MSEADISKPHEKIASTPLQVHLETVLRGHTQEVNHLCFSPDGQLLTSGDDEAISLWRLAETEYVLFHTIEKPVPSHTSRISFSADGALLAGAVTGLVRLWSSNGKIVADLSGDGLNITEALFSSNGHLLVSGDVTGQVQLWNVATRQLISNFWATPHREASTSRRTVRQVRGFAFTRDDTRLALIANDSYGAIQLWQIKHAGADVEWLGAVGEPKQILWTVAFSPDGRFLAASDFNRDVVWLFNASSFAPVGILNIPDKDTPQAISFSPDGCFLAVGGGAGTVWIWEMTSQQIVTSFGAHIEGCDYRKESQLLALGGIAWAPQGGLIATSGTSPATFYDERRQRYLGPNDYTVKLWRVHIAS